MIQQHERIDIYTCTGKYIGTEPLSLLIGKGFKEEQIEQCMTEEILKYNGLIFVKENTPYEEMLARASKITEAEIESICKRRKDESQRLSTT